MHFSSGFVHIAQHASNSSLNFQFDMHFVRPENISFDCHPQQPSHSQEYAQNIQRVVLHEPKKQTRKYVRRHSVIILSKKLACSPGDIFFGSIEANTKKLIIKGICSNVCFPRTHTQANGFVSQYSPHVPSRSLKMVGSTVSQHILCPIYRCLQRR